MNLEEKIAELERRIEDLERNAFFNYKVKGPSFTPGTQPQWWPKDYDYTNLSTLRN